MEIKDLQKRAMEVREKFSQFEKQNAKEWGNSEIMEGFVGDVGDLMKLVMAKEGKRKIEKVDEKLKHELADCLHCILVLSNNYQVDIEKIFLDTMNDVELRLRNNNY